MPRNTEKIEEKKEVLKSSKKLQNARKDIIDFFEKRIFPYRSNVFKTKEEESEENILRMKQKILTIVFLIIISIL